MGNKKKAFSIFKKKLSNGVEKYYYTTYDHENKRRQFSTNTNDYQEAVMECSRRATEGKLVPNSKVIFSNYVKNFFIHGKCPYCTARELKGTVYSKGALDNKRGVLTNHLLPVFGEMRLDYITVDQIETWLARLNKKGYSANSINNYLAILRTIFAEAVRLDIISKNPCDKVIRYRVKKSEKNLLAEDEYNRLFDREKIEEIWGDKVYFLMNLTTSVTGMRIGEIQALKPEDIHDYYIEINNSWDRKYGLKSTKVGKSRIAPISPSLSKELKELVNDGRRFVFSGSEPFKPLSRKSICSHLNNALSFIGIDDEQRKKRGLTYHAWRYFANSNFRKEGIPEVIVRNIIGHSSTQMSDHYTSIDMVEYSKSHAQ